ncbi:tyrosine-type recombinase/integrase [Oleiagrimonas sp. C23AA]|uniref:tyrosine-type recombinase/integrase n=1 Tax=Oleiagrimonas sp. C23AA TaxID=2719047 RepID=UPI0014204A23|nr:tyrosine-type recombinase/integrase [Oleiagrimonas sp. C23AA]NII10294.1 tyrosine-type recombinase/integrase [Oleiagrimonas sp. C23AA]
MEKPQQVISFRYVADRYRAEVIPTKAPRTQVDNAAELAKLIEFFDNPPCPLDAITPQHVKQYIRWRSKTAKVRANRERALLSHIWNWSRGERYTALPNPCAGIKGNSETGRDIYVEDDAYTSMWEKASQMLHDAMGLAYLTGQRPADTLRMDEAHIKDGCLEVRQGKTSKKLRVTIDAELRAIIARVKARKRENPVYSTRLVVLDNGQPPSIKTLQKHWQDARTAARLPTDIQFRDLRAKAGTDTTDQTGDIRKAQQQLGHQNLAMTEHYVRQRRGDKVNPTVRLKPKSK